jgi:hypothetical protein
MNAIRQASSAFLGSPAPHSTTFIFPAHVFHGAILRYRQSTLKESLNVRMGCAYGFDVAEVGLRPAALARDHDLAQCAARYAESASIV